MIQSGRRDTFAERNVMECVASTLLRLDVGRPDHLAPLLGFVGNERPEIGRRATEDNATQVR